MRVPSLVHILCNTEVSSCADRRMVMSRTDVHAGTTESIANLDESDLGAIRRSSTLCDMSARGSVASEKWRWAQAI